ncbi:MAG: hypothetical protein ACI9U2_002819, partial [Bradymonadia bacterium]
MAPSIGRWARVFAIASLVHLTLPDFEQDGWLIPALIEAAGALWLLWRPHRLGFALCALGTLWPLLLGRDVLTQSALLTLWALIGAVGGTRRLDAVRVTTAATYAFAALHKLNTAFFDPATSCGHHAWTQIVDRYPLPDLGAMPWMPYFIVAIEVALAVGIWRRAPWVWPLGIAFHLPLTVTLAPAFGAVMIAGWAAAVSAKQWARWRQAWGPSLLVGAVIAGALEVALAAELEPVNVLKVMAAGALLVASLKAWVQPGQGRPIGAFAWICLGVWSLNCLTPYLGVQYQHSAAMLSNLRIDKGCHNSVVMPEALRIVEPYIRIEDAQFAHGIRRTRAARLKATLWNLPALATMHRNWCIPENRPI